MNYFFAKKKEKERKQAYEHDFKNNTYNFFGFEYTNKLFFWP